MIPHNLDSAVEHVMLVKPNAILIEWVQGQFGNIAAVVQSDTTKYMVFFIRQWFRSFGSIMRIGKCEGVTIPTHALEKAVVLNAMILFVTPDGPYQIDSAVFNSYVKNNGTIWKNPRTGIHESGVSLDMLEAVTL